ncbi:MAG: hypothetical protein ACP5U1_00290 [Desulfomonilaceae bacterium]
MEQITLVFLLGVFTFAEIYRAMKSVRGFIVSVDNPGLENFFGETRTVIVRLKSGKEIEAKLNQCAACIARMNLGSEVRVFKGSDGYVVDPVWFNTRKACSFSQYTKPCG